MKHYLGAFIRIGFAVACIIYALWDIDVTELWSIAQRYSIEKILMVVFFSLVTYAFLGLRLAYLMHHHINVAQGWVASLLALGINNLFPAKLGELLKIVYLSQQANVSKTEAFGVVFWERFFDLNALLLLGLLSVYALNQGVVILPLAFAVIGLWFALLIIRYYAWLVKWVLSRIPSRRVVKFLIAIQHHVNARLSWRLFFLSTLMTLFLWLQYALQGILVFLWVVDFDLTIPQGLAVFVLSALSMAIPSSPGALGVFEAAVVLGLSWFGIDKESALMAAVLLHMIQYIPTSVIGLILLSRTKISVV